MTMGQSVAYLLATHFIIVLLVSIPNTTSQPLYNNRLVNPVDPEKELSADGEIYPKLPPINVNIIFVPVIREPDLKKETETLVDYNNRDSIPSFEKLSKIKSAINPSSYSSSLSYPRDVDPMEMEYLTNEIVEEPAKGIITPQPERGMCRSQEIYDKELKQCIRATTTKTACPVCRRVPG